MKGHNLKKLTPKAHATKEKIDKLDLVEIKNLCFKGQNQEGENTLTKWEKILANHIVDKRLVSRI